MKLAVIPARGGSKRIKQKNIKQFFGRPILEYSIDAARKSELFEEIVVSTDSAEIAEVARKAGATVPTDRPAELSDHYSTIGQVMEHTLDWFGRERQVPDYACMLLATAPFVRPADLTAAFDKIVEGKCTTVVPITSFPYPIYRALEVTAESRLKFLWPEHELTRSNDLPDAFHDTGQFYWINVDLYRKEPRLIGPNAGYIEIPRYLAQDIDTEEDWRTAELLYAAIQKTTSGEPK